MVADPVEFGVCNDIDCRGPSVRSLRQVGIWKFHKWDLSGAEHLKWSYCRRDEAAIRDYLDWLASELSSTG